MPQGSFAAPYVSHHVDTPASESLETLLGTNPTVLDVTIDDDLGTDMHSVWCALAPTALSAAKWLVYASALTWTTMSSGGADTAMWNNNSRYTTSASYQTATLDTSQYPAGKYRLLARVKQAAGTGYVMDSQNATAIAVTRTTPHILVISDLDLPTADTAPGTVAPLTFSVKSDGTNRFDVNAFVLLPLEYGYFSWHHATPTTVIDQLDVGPSGVYMDHLTDLTYFNGSVMVPKVLAAHVGTLIATASPTGNTYPTDWDKTATGVSADTSRFKCVGANKYAWYAATNTGTPLVIPGAWYELSFVRDVDSWVAGTASADIVWQDVDGNTVRTDTLSSVAANDGSPTAVTVYAKAPVHAVRARVRLGTNGAGNLTVYWSSVVLRRCPLHLIVVAESVVGVLQGNLHPVHLSVSYTPRYELAR